MDSESSPELLCNSSDQPSNDVIITKSVNNHSQANYDNLLRHLRSTYGFNSSEPIPSLDFFIALIDMRNTYQAESKSPFLFCTTYNSDETVVYSFLWDGSDLYLMSNRSNGIGSYSQSRRVLKLVDLTTRGAHFELYNLLLPQFPSDYKRMEHDYRLSEINARYLGTFSETRLLMLDQSDESGQTIVPVLLERSSNGWLTLASVLFENYDESVFYIAAMQGLICLLNFQEKQIDFGDLSANNVILFPDACGYVPIDLSTLQFSDEVMKIPAPISTFFDPELGPYQRASQVDRFSLAMNMLFVSVHLAHQHDVQQAILSLTTICQSCAFLSESVNGGLSILDRYKRSYQHLSTIIIDNVDLPELFEIFLQLVHPESHKRPSLWDIFNRVEIVRVAIRSIKQQSFAHYSTSKNFEFLYDINHLVTGTALDEKEESINTKSEQSSGDISGVFFLSLLIYCCHNSNTDPSAIRDHMNKLLDLVRDANHQLLDTHSSMIHRYESRFPQPSILEQVVDSMSDEISCDIFTDILQEERSTQFKSRKKEVESPTTVHTFFAALSCDQDKELVSQTSDDLSRLSI